MRVKSGQLVHLILLCCLFCQHAFALGLSSYNARVMLEQADADTTLICTGSTMRWVSISQSEKLGTLVFVTPDNTDVEDSSILCISKVISDIQPFTELASQHHVFSIGPVALDASPSITLPYSSYQYKKNRSRAPPLN